MPKLRFAENTADEGEGLSDAGIETYRDDPFPAVARETVQNSRDAHDESPTPVRIEFNRMQIPKEEFPDLQGYTASAYSCLKIARADKDEKEIAFFEQALNVLKSDSIPVLKIADYNTKGLRGPCVSTPRTPFYALVKSSGSSEKENQSAGGSFGIGKSAVYAASDLQTALYSTVYQCTETGEPKFLCQAKTKFRSHIGEDGNAYRSTGYWGNPDGYLPVESHEDVPEWARRERQGTSVYALGVRDSQDWKDRLVCSIIVNFYGAISKGEMELLVEGQVINKSTLLSLFENTSMREHARTYEDFDMAKLALECLTSPTLTEEFEIQDIGRFRLNLLMQDALPKRVIILRNGMMVCSELGHFGDKLQRFSLHRDFIAVLEPIESIDDTTNSSEWMRRLENPRHDELSPERLSKEAERRTAAAKGRELAQRVREIIKAEAKKPAGQRTALDELSKFFADDTPREEDSLGQRGIQTVKVNPTRKKENTQTTKTSNTTDDGNNGGATTDHGEGSQGDSSGSGSGSGTGGEGASQSSRSFNISDIRTIIPDLNSPTKRIVYFTPQESGTVTLSFSSSGLTEAEELILSNGEKAGTIKCVSNQRIGVDVEFNSPYTGPIEVSAATSG